MNDVPIEEWNRTSAMSTPQLIAHIVETYHEPLRQSLPDLQVLAMHTAHEQGRLVPVMETAATCTTDVVDAAFGYLDEYDRDIFPVLAGRYPAPRGFTRSLSHVRETAHELLRLVLRAQRSVAWLRHSRCATVLQRDLVGRVDALATRLYAQVTVETEALLARAA